MEFEGWVDYSVPTAEGLVVLRNHFTETVKPLSDPAHAAEFHGDRFSGRTFVQRTEGDCVHTPLTKLEFGWIGRWHGEPGGQNEARRDSWLHRVERSGVERWCWWGSAGPVKHL